MLPEYALGSVNLHNAPYWVKRETLDFSQPGRIRFTLVIDGSDADDRIARVAAVQNVINAAPGAESIGQSVTFTVRRGGTADAIYDVTGGTMVESALHQGMRSSEHIVELTCLPHVRTEPVVVTIAGTLSGDEAQFLIDSVPGNAPALGHLELTDTSPTGVIDRLRWVSIPGNFTTLLDYTALSDAAAMAGALSSAESTAFGGSYTHRTMTDLSHADIARLVMPSGAQHQGRMDGYARVWGSGTVIGTPTSLAAGVTAPTSTTVTSTVKTPRTIDLRASGVVNSPSVGADDVTVTLDQTTLAGSLLMGFISHNGSLSPLVTPTDWTRLGLFTYGTQGTFAVYYRRNAPAISSQQFVWGTTDIDHPNQLTAVVLEFTNVHPTSGIINAFNRITDAGTSTNTLVAPDPDADPDANPDTPAPEYLTAFAGELVVAAFAAGETATAAGIGDFWLGGYDMAKSTGRMGIGWRVYDSPDTKIVASLRTLASWSTYRGAVLSARPIVDTLTNTEITFQEPIPGELSIGTYGARIRAIDASRSYSNASSTVDGVVTVDRSSIGWSWVAATNAVAYELSISFGSAVYRVVTTGTSYTLTDLANLEQVDALPATTGAVAPLPFVRARIGTENDHVMSAMPEVLVPSVAPRLVRLFSDRPLPPVNAPLFDDWLAWAVEAQGRSANGQSATVNVDALWVVPSSEPQGIAEIHGLAHSTKRRWVLESHRSGRGVIGWLEDTGTGAEAGRLKTTGSLLFPSGGACIGALIFEQEDGLSQLDAEMEAALTMYPRWFWGHGA